MSQDLVTLLTVPSEFEANLLAIVLRDNDIEAFVFASSASGIGVPFSGGTLGIPLQVSSEDVEKAKEVLAENKRDSIDIDWNELQLADSDHEFHEPTMMRLPAKIAFFITAIVLLIGLAISLFITIA
ncbi:MAG TPA: DUF2007 domain-containing protein [Phycisphaerales bacterium]|jgi:hypothetical protein|nr:DUF2007 domain-containing protein [Phycisphaerales bacterium]